MVEQIFSIMKIKLTHFLALAAVALLWAGGCEKTPEEGTDTPPATSGEGVTRFSAVIATPELSRAYVSGENEPSWKVGDNMLVLTYKGSITQFKTTVEGSSLEGATGYFNAPQGRTIVKGLETYAVHPYFQPKLADVSGGKQGEREIIMTLGKQTPSFSDKLHLPLLVGEWNDDTESFTMHNPLMVVRLKMALPAEESDLQLKRVEVVGNNDEVLWGSKATIYTSDMSIEFDAEGAMKSLSLDDLNDTLGADGKTLTFCIPAQAYSKGLKVKIYCMEGYYEEVIKPSGLDLPADSVLEVPMTLALTKTDIFADVVRATDSTVAVAWSHLKSNVQYLSMVQPNAAANYTDDLAKSYKVALYKDEACTQLVYSASELVGEKIFKYKEVALPPRFVFTGLVPSTDYYVHIYNLTDTKQTLMPLKITTTTSVVAMNRGVYNYSQAGDIILFENFEGLIYGGDNTVCAAGVSRDDRNTLTSFAGVDLSGDITLDYDAADTDGNSAAYTPAAANIEMGLFNTIKGLVDDLGLDKWGWIGGKEDANGGSVCARPGFLKIGTSGNRSFVVTPELTSIPAGVTATVTVKFKAAPYGDPGYDIKPEEKAIAVKVLNDTSLSGAYKVSYASEGESKKLTLDGDYGSDWKEYSVTLKNVSSTSRIAIGGGRENATDSNRFCLDDITVSIDSLSDKVVVGQITYDDGTPAAGVVVSDGFACVQTDANGRYSILPHQYAYYIYYSIPEDAEVSVNGYGQPCFFTRYTSQQSTYNFTLKRIAKESKFSLFCLADVQCANTSNTTRFKNEAAPDIASHALSKQIPCYGVTLGDVVYSEGNRNCEALMPTLRSLLSKSALGIPVFQTFGNHDYSYLFSDSNPISGGYNDLELQMQLQRSFENVFGPINYSWNRGDVHIVSMRNLLWWDGKAWNHYNDPMFLNEQYEWLKQDLASVPTDKMVILCVHCAIWNSTKQNVQNVLKLLSKYKEVHIMSGHHHRNTNEPTKSTVNGKAIYEHNHGAVCGSFWRSTVNGDGSPNGYGVYEIEGNTIKNWYYKGVNKGMNDRNYQMRLYRGNLRCGGQYDYVQLQHGANVILANVFNSDVNWKVEIYEDGVKAGDMTLMPDNTSGPSTYSESESNPSKPSVKSSLDWWAVAYDTGVKGRGHPNVGGTRANYFKNCTHMYKWTLKNANAKTIKVVATDIFGTKYECSEITGDYDYTLMNY